MTSCTTIMSSVDTQHEDMIHDAQLDYYAKKLATCSSDRTIRIYDVSGAQQTPLAVLQGHDGPVWQVAWAHPKFGVLLASCSYDGKVIIFREAPANNWTQIYVHAKHESSVNSIAWAPYEYGHPMLACASSDGKVSIIEHRADGWRELKTITDSSLGCNSISWAPYDPKQKQIVTGSCDNSVKIWKCLAGQDEFEPKPEILAMHTDWVRDVAWAPSSGLPSDIIASCSESKEIFIHEKDADGNWQEYKFEKSTAPLWKVSWSITGHVLAVSSGDHEVTLWKQKLDKKWMKLPTAEGS